MTPRCRCWRRVSGGPQLDGCGSMCATIGCLVGRPLRLRPISTALIVVPSIRRRTWRASPASFRLTATLALTACTIRPGRSQVRSRKLHAGRTAAGSFSTFGRPPSRRLPKRRWIGSPRSMQSRTRRGSLPPPSGWNTGARQHRCSISSSTGPRRRWSSFRANWSSPKRSATRLIGAKHSPASSPTGGSRRTTTSPRTRCVVSRCLSHCTPPVQVSGNIGI